jgi:S-adenosylmethionine hydrolase
MTLITLLSDFGLKDPYVAEMKAVILSINPQILIVDITHEIEKFNIHMAAFFLASAAPYFPPKTVHLAVVDPGVGTKRRPVVVETEQSFFVGPDNGLLMLAAQKEGIIKVCNIVNPNYMSSRVSRTFHGRDIFAPAAAYLATGTNPAEFGPAIRDYVFPEFVKPKTIKGEVVGEVLHVDGFGNVISNISKEDLEKTGVREGDSLFVRLNGKTLTLQFCSAYGEVPVGTVLAIVGSSDFLEVAVNKGSASRTLNATVGDSFCISGTTSN